MRTHVLVSTEFVLFTEWVFGASMVWCLTVGEVFGF